MNDIGDQLDAWLQRCPNPQVDPLPGMAESGLQEPAPDYLSIARIKSALVERTGLPGVAGVWGGRQVVGRFFIDGFGDAAQRAMWRGRALSVAISEPKVGAHPKLLTTQAEADGDGFRIRGEKAWVSNGPSADAIIVLAITSVESGRKRYSAFVVPRDAAGVTLTEMPGFHALRPSRHCGLVLDGVRVPRSALLGAVGSAYESMALPFRDVEDAVGTFGLLGVFRFLQRRLSAEGDAARLSLGGLVALSAVFADAAEAVVEALDADCLATKSATLVGLRVLAEEWVKRAREHLALSGPAGDAKIEAAFADIDAMLSVARGPRMARQARLARV
ncbi:MAG TPA: acyl-CoA dehydrogenase family protein [Acetobacteraceae bacterium]|jgi:acyl-CoA dehydrogenase